MLETLSEKVQNLDDNIGIYKIKFQKKMYNIEMKEKETYPSAKQST